MEHYSMPLHQIEETYTLSEVTLQAWRSQEQGYQMRQKAKGAKKTKPHATENEVEQRLAVLDKIYENDEPVTDENGGFTLKHMPGHKAASILRAMGLPISSL